MLPALSLSLTPQHAERKAQYEAARERILGPSGSGAGSRKSSSGDAPAGGGQRSPAQSVARQPQGPAGSRGFGKRE